MLLGVIVVAAGVVSFKQPVLKHWWLWKSGSRDQNERHAAAVELKKIAAKEAAEAFEVGAYKGVLPDLLEIEEAFTTSAVKEDAELSFLVAECYFHLNDYERAYEYYQKSLDRRPDKDTVSSTQDRLGTIGRAFLEGRRRLRSDATGTESRGFGVTIFIGEKGLLTRYPYRATADGALLSIAEFFLTDGQYRAAEKTYERILREYAQSSRLEEAHYGIAVSVYKQIGRTGDERHRRPAT